MSRMKASSWRLPSSMLVMVRAAKKRSCRKRLARSTPPLSVGRLGLHRRGWTRSAPAISSSPGWIAHGVAVAREHDGLGVVEEPLPRHALEEPGGAHERAAQRLDGQVEDQLGPHRARVGEHHDEDPERTHAAGDGERADVSPVDLRLLADERARSRYTSPRGTGRTSAT